MNSPYTRVKEELRQLVALHPLNSVRDRVADHICDRDGTGCCTVAFKEDTPKEHLEPFVARFKAGVSEYDVHYRNDVIQRLGTIRYHGEDEERTQSREAIRASRAHFQPKYNGVVMEVAEAVVESFETKTRNNPPMIHGQRVVNSTQWRRALLDADYIDRRIEAYMESAHKTRLDQFQPVLD